jgi:hypothetical protein
MRDIKKAEVRGTQLFVDIGIDDTQNKTLLK